MQRFFFLIMLYCRYGTEVLMTANRGFISGETYLDQYAIDNRQKIRSPSFSNYITSGKKKDNKNQKYR